MHNANRLVSIARSYGRHQIGVDVNSVRGVSTFIDIDCAVGVARKSAYVLQGTQVNTPCHLIRCNLRYPFVQEPVDAHERISSYRLSAHPSDDLVEIGNIVCSSMQSGVDIDQLLQRITYGDCIGDSRAFVIDGKECVTKTDHRADLGNEETATAARPDVHGSPLSK